MDILPAERLDPSATSTSLIETEASRLEPVLMVAACPFPCRRGTPIRIERLAETIGRSGRQVHVVAYHYGGDTDAPSLGTNRSANTEYHLHRILKVPGRWNPAPGPGLGKLLVLNPLLLSKTLKVVRKHGIRLLHCHHYEALLVGLAVRRVLPVSIVYDAHTLLGDELSYYAPSVFEAPLNRFGAFLDRTLPKRADHIIPVTEDIHDKLAAHSGTTQKMTIVGNGIEDTAIASFSQETEPVVPGSVVYAGNLAAYQGIEHLLEAFSLVVAERTDARLVLVSPSPHEPVMAKARALGIGEKVRTLDADSANLPRELCRADVLVNPRIHCPGYPLKLLNYMAAARPIVSFKSSGKNLRNEIDACVVPDGDVPGFAGGILELLSDRDRGDRLGKAARSKVFAHYSWDAITKRVDAAYDQAMEVHIGNTAQGSI